ncbi:MAG: hypothetical protein LBU77_01275 [Clostridiales bacterium]|nr:hypothetical protein [Clostridiales bacterium]
MKKGIDLRAHSTMAVVLFIQVLVIGLLVSMTLFRGRAAERQAEDIAQVVRSAAVQCYALEGSYPPDIYYLADHYGVVLDEENFLYYYTVYGSNIMPDVQVFRIQS